MSSKLNEKTSQKSPQNKGEAERISEFIDNIAELSCSVQKDLFSITGRLIGQASEVSELPHVKLIPEAGGELGEIVRKLNHLRVALRVTASEVDRLKSA